MIAIVFLSFGLQAMMQTASGLCTGDDFANFYRCANEKTAADFKDLGERKLVKVLEEESRMQKCVTDGGCDVKLDYKTKWFSFIKPPPLDNTFALIQKFWDSQHGVMQQCELGKSLNPLNQQVTECVQKTFPDFKLPDTVPDPMMPPPDMMSKQMPLVRKYIENRISALVQTNHCSKETKSRVQQCISDDAAKSVHKCVNNKFCQSPKCGPTYNALRAEIQKCFVQIVPDYQKPFSVLEEVDEHKAMDTLTYCENLARRVSGYSKFKYNRREAKIIYDKDTQVIAGGLGTNFRYGIKALMDAYFNSESFLDVSCEA